MRSFRLLLVAVVLACGPQVAPTGASVGTPPNCQPLPAPSATPSAPLNESPLAAQPLASPSSKIGVRFVAPELAEEIPVDAWSSYQVRLLRDMPGVEATPLDVALDGGRTRRLSTAESSIALGRLVAAGAELGAGDHWLFAAPVLDSGLVPRPAPGAPRAGRARHFFIGKPVRRESGPTGAVWLRKPEGTYNGAQLAARVLFDVFVFSASGEPIEAPYTVALHGPSVSGELRFPSPFAVHDVPSGDYEVTVSALTAEPVRARFVVNRELGGPP